MTTYTVFCRDGNDLHSTIWISAVEADNAIQARKIGRDECADDWGYGDEDESCGDPETIQVLGVVEGTIALLDWDDDGLRISE